MNRSGVFCLRSRRHQGAVYVGSRHWRSDMRVYQQVGASVHVALAPLYVVAGIAREHDALELSRLLERHARLRLAPGASGDVDAPIQYVYRLNWVLRLCPSLFVQARNGGWPLEIVWYSEAAYLSATAPDSDLFAWPEHTEHCVGHEY